MNDERWTRDDQTRADAFAQRIVGTVREAQMDPQVVIHGFIEALGTMIADDLGQRPQRLALYLSMLAALVDHVSPMPVEGGPLH